MNRCTCTAPTPSAQRSMVLVGQQMGLYGMRVGRTQTQMEGILEFFDDGMKPAPPTSVGGVLIGEDGLPVIIGGVLIGADGLPIVKAPNGTTPGAVGVVPSAWDLDATPAKYTLQSGDTLSGLAITYLGNGTRWKEIWAAQDAAYKAKRTPDKIYVGDVLNMPAEAAANAHKLIQGGAGGTQPGKGGGGLLAAILIGGTVAAATAGVLYVASKGTARRRRGRALAAA